MCDAFLKPFLLVGCALAVVITPVERATAQITSQDVLSSIERGKHYLSRQQRSNGSWSTNVHTVGPHTVGVTSLAVLALINAGMTPADKEVAHALKFLRGAKVPDRTYDISLIIMVLTAAKDGRRDSARIASLSGMLESSQLRRGERKGTWSYYTQEGGMVSTGGGDRSNGQYAVLALRDAHDYGVPVEPETWRRARDHWFLAQQRDGGWGYSPGQPLSTGSMTVAGIATMTISNSMLQTQDELDDQGNPICCAPPTDDKYLDSLNRGIRWMEKNFAVGHNPRNNNWLLYYLYGLERAGRLSARRFFGRHDWYREGAEFLVSRQSRLSGNWKGVGPGENDPVVGTSFALLFLSKGMAPVLINKLKFGPRNERKEVRDNDWNNHRDDVNNLTLLISGLPKWPKLLTWQTVDSSPATVSDLRQAPVLFLSGQHEYTFTDAEIDKFKDYVSLGGTIFAEACCRGQAFDASFREVVKQMYPQGEATLRRLPAEHEIYRSEFLIDPETVELWGVDLGCRTAIIFSPRDLSCLWDKWQRQDPPGRSPQLKQMIVKATRVGVNVIAYATGRQPPTKSLGDDDVAGDGNGRQDKVTRGLLQIAKLRYGGNWNPAPNALRNLLIALNKSNGTTATTKQRDLIAIDRNLFKYPVLFLHGRHSFNLSKREQENLREYLNRGGVMFADACCGSSQFDKSFRNLMVDLYPEIKLKRIPPDHEMFTEKFGHDLQRVRLRSPEADNQNVALNMSVRQVEPYLEGIEVDGRYVVIYSKFDISCALERQASVACSGYVHEDAIRIGINVLLYAMLR